MAKALLDVLQGRMPERRPVWLMRQAGRYLPEYRAVRSKAGSFLDLCYNPELAAEVTLQPLRRYDFDAAIIFADILVVPHAMGCDLSFVENEGPLLSAVRNAKEVEGLADVESAWQFERVYESLALTRARLGSKKTLIAFCGAPWTVASYMIEGRGSNRQIAVAAAEENAAWFQRLLEKIIVASVTYLLGQIRAGAEVLQIFDSWAGDLPTALREICVHRPIAAIIRGVRKVFPDFPIIVFGRGLGGGHAALASATGASAVSVEQGSSLRTVLEGLPEGVAVQGNLAPDLLLAGGPELENSVREICAAVPQHRHVFNLGHGILQQTPVEHVSSVLAIIRQHDGDAVHV